MTEIIEHITIATTTDEKLDALIVAVAELHLLVAELCGRLEADARAVQVARDMSRQLAAIRDGNPSPG